mmetsp:Transcript_1287/g.2532  ORF Transcript_1287/g.2532 Transcript_1287/m.2532 type:complete len:475 (-) Transcript_1287:351-1775(-)
MLHHHALRMLLEPGGQIAEVVLAIAGHRLEQHPLLCEHPEAQRPARQRRVEGVGNRIGVEAGAERLGHLAVGQQGARRRQPLLQRGVLLEGARRLTDGPLVLRVRLQQVYPQEAHARRPLRDEGVDGRQQRTERRSGVRRRKHHRRRPRRPAQQLVQRAGASVADAVEHRVRRGVALLHATVDAAVELAVQRDLAHLLVPREQRLCAPHRIQPHPLAHSELCCHVALQLLDDVEPARGLHRRRLEELLRRGREAQLVLPPQHRLDLRGRELRGSLRCCPKPSSSTAKRSSSASSTKPSTGSKPSTASKPATAKRVGVRGPSSAEYAGERVEVSGSATGRCRHAKGHDRLAIQCTNPLGCRGKAGRCLLLALLGRRGEPRGNHGKGGRLGGRCSRLGSRLLLRGDLKPRVRHVVDAPCLARLAQIDHALYALHPISAEACNPAPSAHHSVFQCRAVLRDRVASHHRLRRLVYAEE